MSVFKLDDEPEWGEDEEEDSEAEFDEDGLDEE